MKQLLIILASIAVLSLPNINIFAQDYKSTVCVDVGVSITINFYPEIALTEEDFSDEYIYSSLPVFQLTYDFMITNWLSTGIAGSYQQYKLYYSDEEILINLKRSNIAVRGLFHYGNFDRIDMYSGVRLGTTLWNSDIDNDNSTITIVEDGDHSDFSFSPQLIVFGIRVYFTDNIGAHVELVVGDPYFAVGGINFRF